MSERSIHDSKKTHILKFGGGVLKSPESFKKIAEKIEGERVVVVVSAMSGMTDQLIEMAQKVHPNPPRREVDMLISVGERVSISLLAMALDRLGRQAVSFTGSQSGIITSSDHGEARIVDVRPSRIVETLDRGQIAIVAGFQGVSQEREITTLGRGGSDTSAVALAIALGAEVRFVKDVPGIFSKHPSEEGAERCLELSSSEAIEIIEKTGTILHPRAIELAEKNGRSLFVCDLEGEGTWIRSSKPLSEVRYEQPLSTYSNALR